MSSPQLLLKSISNDIFLSVPCNATSYSREKDPQMVVLLGWMDAHMRHLKKYIGLHHELYPSTPVLLIRAHFHHWPQWKGSRLASLLPALQIIPKSRVLYHAFSNGGCLRFVDLLSLRPLSPDSQSKILFDSCPGIMELEPTVQALLLPIKSTLFYIIAHLAVTPFLFIWALLDHIRGRPDIIEAVRQPLNDADIVPKEIQRAYIFSDEDTIVQDWAVEAHGKEAIERGHRVTFYRFSGSQHVAHLQHDRERYHQIIQELWRTENIEMI